MVTKYIIPALAAASGAYAQCSAASATTTLTANTDATAIAGCSTYSGSIALATGVAGSVVLDGITVLTGSLVGQNITQVTAISADTLQSIGGSFTLASGSYLGSLNFPELTSVGSLMFTALGPQYQNPGFGKLSSVGTLEIVDTFLQTLSGITLGSSASTVNLAQNQNLNDIELDATSITNSLMVTANADGQATASFPNLETAGGIVVSNITSLSLPALRNVTGQIYLTYNTFTTVSFPNLTSTSAFTLDNNTMMTNFTAPKLTTVTAALNVQDNRDLTGTISLPELTAVDGSAYFVGDFSGLNLPKLNTIQGVLEIDSTKTLDATCAHFSPLDGTTVLGGVTCNGGSDSTQPSGSSTSTTPSETSAGGSTSSATTGAASMQYAPSAQSSFTVFGLLAAFFGLLM